MRHRRFMPLLFASVLWLSRSAAALAQPVPEPEGYWFDDYFRILASEIRQYLESERVQDRMIAVAFNGPPNWQTSGGNRLVEQLTAALAANKVSVKATAAYAFKGEFRMTGSGRLHISGTLVDRFGAPAPRWVSIPPCYDPNPALVATLMGLSVDLQPRSALGVQESVRRSFTTPAIALTDSDGVTARPIAQSAFGVRVLVDKKPRKLTSQSGLAFVDLGLDETFELEIVNDAAHETAAEITVDGLNTFHFSKLRRTKLGSDEPRYRYYIFAPNSFSKILGWEKDETTVRAFKIVPFEECAAVKSGQTTAIGMITIAFHASWEKGRTVPPEDEDRNVWNILDFPMAFEKKQVTLPDGTKSHRWVRTDNPRGGPTTKIGTGFGQDILVSSQGVTREVGATRGLVTIRYVRKNSTAKQP